eukprot:GFYU01011253.1.p1 GENE.GFYU01011253.1~~GFYU01011253.1.p1  ORF type:complete len:147 (-),score=15.79 GFYU01011253.1:110-550(-)
MMDKNDPEGEGCATPQTLGLFCPFEKLTKFNFLEKWKNLSEFYEYHVGLGAAYTMDEVKLIKKLHAHNIMGTAARSIDERTILYFAGRTSDNILILMEIVVDRSNSYFASCNYKSEYPHRNYTFEAFLRELISADSSGESRPVCGR